jgi:hypothetical protein
MTIAEVCSITQALKQAPAEPQLSSLMALHTVTHTLSAVAILLTAMIALATFAESNDWLQAQFPTLNPSQLSTIQSLYPPPPPATHQANTGAPPLQPTTTFATSAQASTQTTWPPISTLRHPLIQKIVPRSTSLLGIISWETISREGARITSVKNRQFQVEATQPPSLRGLRAGQSPFFY